jgi:hypothetical protein
MPYWVRRPAGVAAAPDIDKAYDRGRRDERARKKRHPMAMSLLFVLAAVGAAMLGLAAYNGSFQGAGEAADQGLATAADQAAPIVQNAATRTGEAARDAGAAIRDKAADATAPRS